MPFVSGNESRSGGTQVDMLSKSLRKVVGKLSVAVLVTEQVNAPVNIQRIAFMPVRFIPIVETANIFMFDVRGRRHSDGDPLRIGAGNGPSCADGLYR